MSAERRPLKCVIFGGAGFIGTHLARRLLESRACDAVHLVDIRPSRLPQLEGLSTVIADVRHPIRTDVVPWVPDWIFNFAAVHREPGHAADEYFETNLLGAEHVVAYANAVGCRNIYFTSSISVYGVCESPTDESKLPCPVSPYGASKYPAELIHERWATSVAGRRLVICRPGVVYGAGDPGNILRMIKAVKRGYFIYPGSPNIRKSYAYIEGLLDSIEFTMDRAEPLIKYNYVEYPTEPLGQLVENAKRLLNSRTPVIALPLSLLIPLAKVLHWLSGGRSPVHPMRVKKASRATHIVPRTLLDLGFRFRYDFSSSLVDWKARQPDVFS